MKNKIFSGGVYAESMRKLRVFGFISLAVMLLCELVPPMSAYIDRLQYGKQLVDFAGFEASGVDVVGFESMCMSAIFTVLFITPVMMLILFSGFNKRAFSDFYHSLPYTRTCIYISFIAAVLTWVVGISVVSSAVGIFTRLAMPWAFALSFAGFAKYCIIYFVIAIYLCGGIALACSVTGTLLSNITVSGLIMFFPRYMAYLVCSQLCETSFLVNSARYIPLLSPRYNLLIGSIVDGFFSAIRTREENYSIGPIIYTLIVAVVYLVLAAVLFKKRSSEIAGQSAPGKKTQTVIRSALTLVPSTLGTCAMLGGEWSLALVMYVLSVIVYFAYELLTTMRWHSLLRALPLLAIVVVLNGVMALSIIAMRGAAMSYRPEADEVESVRLVDNSGHYSYTANLTSRLEITDKEVISVVTDTLGDNLDSLENKGFVYNADRESVTTVVAIRSGVFTRHRSLTFDSDDYRKIIGLLKNNEDYKKDIMTLPPPVPGSVGISTNLSGYSVDNVNNEVYEDVLEILQKEINEKGFEAWISSVEGIMIQPEDKAIIEKYQTSSSLGPDSVNISYTVDSEIREYMNITVHKDVYPETYKYITELSWKNAAESEIYSDVLKYLNDYMSGKGSDDSLIISADIGISVLSDGKTYSFYGSFNDGESLVSKGDCRAVVSLFDKLDKTEMPKADRYMCVNISVSYGKSKDYKYSYINFYAPVPEKYNFTANGFAR